MVLILLLCTYGAPWPGVSVTTWPKNLCGIFSAKLLDGHLEVDMFGICSAKLLVGVEEGEAEHEILPCFPSFSCSAELGEEKRW
jgi:hypothetical protein